jgi:4-hydroxybenzoate polyprenyltransferase
LCAAALVLQTTQLMGYQFNFFFPAFVFASTLCSYNFHFLLGKISIEEKLSIQFFFTHIVDIIFILSGAAGAVFFFTLSDAGIVDASIAFVLTCLYSLPLLSVKRFAFTRKAGFVKTILLAFTWTFVTAYLPLHTIRIAMETTAWYLLVQRFLFMLMLCILFDNRDIAADKIKGLHSLATDLPPKTMQWLVYLIFILLFTVNFLFRFNGATSLQSMALQLAALNTFVVYFFSNKKQGFFFYYFLVDGLMILSALLTTIASI